MRETVSRGKHLLTRVEGDLTVHTHMRMDGSWRIVPAGDGRGGPPGIRAGDTVRLVLGNDEWLALGVRLGVVDLLPTGLEYRAVGHLGPDPLGPDWDAEEAARRLRRAPERPVGEALLDQRNIAGLGTIYGSETLFVAGVSPWRPAGAVEDLAGLAALARRMLEAHKEPGGRHGLPVATGDPHPGRRVWVYGRGGRPCLRCGTPVGVADMGAAGNEAGSDALLVPFLPAGLTAPRHENGVRPARNSPQAATMALASGNTGSGMEPGTVSRERSARAPEAPA